MGFSDAVGQTNATLIRSTCDEAGTLLQPSRATLERFGNTSSSSVWYMMGFQESVGRVRAGDLVWQVGFGSGFKVNSAVWKSLRRNTYSHGAWSDFGAVVEGRTALGLRV